MSSELDGWGYSIRGLYHKKVIILKEFSKLKAVHIAIEYVYTQISKVLV